MKFLISTPATYTTEGLEIELPFYREYYNEDTDEGSVIKVHRAHPDDDDLTMTIISDAYNEAIGLEIADATHWTICDQTFGMNDNADFLKGTSKYCIIEKADWDRSVRMVMADMKRWLGAE